MNRFLTKTIRATVSRLVLLSSLFPFAAPPRLVFAGSGEHAHSAVAARARQLAGAGQAEEAIRILRAALAAQPADLDARLALADIYAGNKNEASALLEFREAIRLHPESATAEIAFSEFYINDRNPASAEALLNGAVRQNPQSTDLRAQLALVLALERKYQNADREIRVVPAPIDPNARIGHFRLVASIQSGLGNAHSAAHAMRGALRVRPADPELQLFTSMTEAAAGEWPTCLQHISPLFGEHPSATSGLLLLRAELHSHVNFTSTLQRVRALSLPQDQELRLRIELSEILAASDRDVEAAEDLQAALKIPGNQDDLLRYNLAVEQYRSRRFDEASATLLSLRSQDDSAEVEDLAGDIEEQKGNLTKAVDRHQKAVAMAPQQEEYRLSLGAELLEYRAYQQAATTFEQAAALFPASARIQVGLGMSYFFLEKYDDSVSAFLRAAKLDGDSGNALKYLAATQVNNAAGPTPLAVAALCRRADSHPKDADAVTWCSVLQFKTAYLANDRSAASTIIRGLRAAATLAPDNPLANCSLGQVFDWMEQLPEARRWLEICVRLRPDSSEEHYRLSHVYQRLGMKRLAAEQAALTKKASAEQDQQHSSAKELVDEMLNHSKPALSSK